MKLHYFDQEKPDTDDVALQMCVTQGFVPPGCLLGGSVVWGRVNESIDPCVGCPGPRERCGGRSALGKVPAAPRSAADYGRPARDAQSRRDQHFFMGVDPAPSIGKRSDDGALVAGRARPLDPSRDPTSNLSDWLFEYVWAYRLRGASARQWSGLIHRKHQHFHLTGIMLDPNGGGTWVMQELSQTRQLIEGVETECTPIACPGDVTAGHAHFILNLFKRGDTGIGALWPILQGDDNLVDAMHVAFQQAVEHTGVAFPATFNERTGAETELWPVEKQWAAKNLDQVAQQLVQISVGVLDNGFWDLTARHARRYSAEKGKKDFAYAAIYAYVRFLIWLKMNMEELDEDGGGAMFACG